MNSKTLFKAVSLFLLLFLSHSDLCAQVDVLTTECFTARNVSYLDFQNVSLSTSVKYSGWSAQSDNNAIQLRWNKDRKSGIVTTFSEQNVKSVKIEWGSETLSGRQVVIYGKHETPYDFAEAFKSSKNYNWGDKLAVIANGDQSVYDFSGKGYPYIGIRSEEGVVYLKSITIEWDKRKRNIHFEKDLYEIVEGESFVAPKLEGAEAYSSSDVGVAVVDSKTGEVKIQGCGTTTIIAKFSETDIYQEETLQYTLMVHPNSTQTVSFDFSKYEDMFPGYALNEPLPEVFSLRDGDLEVVVHSGDSPSFFTMRNGLGGVCLYLASKAKMVLKVPEGHKITKAEMSYKHPGAKPIKKEQPFANSVIYSVADAAGCYGLTLEVDYTGTYKIRIGSAQHATFSGNRAYVMPKGLEGGIVEVDEANQIARASFCVHQGDVVAGNQALLLRGNPGEYTLVPTEQPGASFDASQNNLFAVLTSLKVVAPENHRFYVLSRKNGKLGFFWQKGSNEGLDVQNMANKACLQLPIHKGAGVKGYLLGIEESTGIEHLSVPDQEHNGVYSLSGMRINCSIGRLPKGVYIISGKKIFVK